MLREFYGWTELQLQQALAQAQSDLANGLTVTSTGSGDLNGSGLMAYTPRERIMYISRALYELDPVKYEIYAAMGQNRTNIVFSGSPQAARGY